MVYSKTFQQAYQITKNNKFLWIFGLFLSLGVLYFMAEANLSSFNKMPDLLSSVIFAAVFLLVVRFTGGLIIAIKAIIDKEQTSFAKTFLVAKLFFTRMVNISLSVYVSISLLLMILMTPIFYMFAHNFVYRARTLIVLAAVIFLPVFIISMLVTILSFLFVVVYDQKFKESVDKSFNLISQHWPRLTGLLVLLAVINLPALFLAYFMVGLQRGLALSIIAGIVFLAVETWFLVFQQVVWVLVFLDLIKPQKLEEEEPVIVPEIAG